RARRARTIRGAPCRAGTHAPAGRPAVTSPDPTKKLAALLKKLKGQHAALEAPGVIPEPPDEFDALVHQLLFSMLLWEASTGQARSAIKRVRDSVVDYNELRVCVPDEVAHVMRS